MKILAFDGSPRKNGNTHLLLDAFLAEIAGRAGPHDHISRCDLTDGTLWDIGPCLGCDRCAGGTCVQKDAMQELYPQLRDADIVALAAPVYFYGLPAQVKCMIDRCQLFFNLSYRGSPIPHTAPCAGEQGVLRGPRKGVLISCGATRGRRLFDGAILTTKYWFDALGIRYEGAVLVPGVDGRGAVLSRPEVFDEVRALARSLLDPRRTV